jgi:glycosyltransferase involved in cell wall biosynthesis
MRIAIVHDYFTQMGGAEKVAEEMFRMFPRASLLSTAAFEDKLPPGLQGATIKTSWMQHLPMMRKYYRSYFLLYPFAVGSLDLSNYDLVFSSSSGYAKGVSASRDAMHICYCHTPMRWAWNFDGYSEREAMSPMMRVALQGLTSALRWWDLGASRQPDHFIANSKVVADRIQKAYGRTAEVIHPPIDVDRFRPADQVEDYYMVLSRMVSYKRLDLAIEACTRLNKRLLVVGTGSHRDHLESIAGPSVQFLGRVRDAEVARLAAHCRALLFPGEEDFGMAPLEVAAAGRPTIAFRAGGATETIGDGSTGLFFDQQTPESLMEAIERFERQEWSPVEIRKRAEEFSVPVFRQRLSRFLERVNAPVSSADLNPVHERFPVAYGMDTALGRRAATSL